MSARLPAPAAALGFVAGACPVDKAGMRTQPIAAHEAAAVVADAAEGAARGRLADAGGPEVHRRADLVRQRVRADGRRPILRLPMVYRGFRAGHNLCSEARVGNVTWQEHLEATRSSGGRS